MYGASSNSGTSRQRKEHDGMVIPSHKTNIGAFKIENLFVEDFFPVLRHVISPETPNACSNRGFVVEPKAQRKAVGLPAIVSCLYRFWAHKI